MNTDIQDALSSVAEVAVFAWSLLDMLFTRILPLVGFLAGHLLLQFGSLLFSVVTSPAAANRRRRPRASTEYSYSWDDLQAVEEEEEVINEGDKVHVLKEVEQSYDVPQAKKLAQEAEENVPVVLKEEEDDHQNSSESLQNTNEEHGQISPRISKEKPSALPSVAEEAEAEAEAAVTTAAEGVLPKSALQEERVTANSNDPGNDKMPAGGSSDTDHTAELSDAQKADLHPSHTHGKHMDGAADVEQRHVSLKANGSAGKMDLKPADTQTSQETTRAARSGKMQGMSGEGVKMQKSSSSRGSRSILRVLPASRSQLDRIRRQRSCRVTFSHADD